jgi:predicted small secreted protein
MLGAAVAINISPTLRAEPVIRKTRIDAASEVSALPIVEIDCAVHSNVKAECRNTAKGDGRDVLAIALICLPELQPPIEIGRGYHE